MDENENIALQEFLKMFLGNTKSYSFTFDFFEKDMDNVFNAIVSQFQNSDKAIVKQIYFFANIVSNAYNTFFLEKYRFDDFKRNIENIDRDKLYYVFFTPKGTITFDLLKIEKDNKMFFIGEEDDSLDNKTYIDATEGKFFDYIYVPKDFKEKELEGLVNSIAKQNKQDELKNIEKEDADKNQKKLEFQEDKLIIKRHENGDIYFDGLSDIERYPHEIVWQYVNQERIKMWLSNEQEKAKLFEEHEGDINKIGELLFKKQREECFDKIRQNLLVKVNNKLRMNNIYNPKQ